MLSMLKAREQMLTHLRNREGEIGLSLPTQNTLAAAGGEGAQLCLLRNFNCGQLRESCQRHLVLQKSFCSSWPPPQETEELACDKTSKNNIFAF